ncbi:endonuclease/exonuclease/phosphatase family protein [Alicyclobacillus sp.]|uniref:endonuclease/exonuclease/phosphatase family protein n=1 Tax=Alicyclobacillus sp. TaxID=61169 RepID=UPI0025BE22A0|nr:endonuclease/exonuclease/phosphatase family protein [Alicyclobacillus sp.]MCL6518061.1 endonuclease/exonuclease/phosphatase family protein [Alicyclobacillus sp.]
MRVRKTSRITMTALILTTLLAVMGAPQAAADTQGASRRTDAGPPGNAPVSLTVMTYNIHWGEGLDGRYDLNRIAQVLKQAHPDLIGLQEVDVCWGPRSQFEDQVVRLASALHMRAFFAPIYRLPAHPHAMGPGQTCPVRGSGVAILTRFPLVATVNHPMARLSTLEPALFPASYPGFADAVIRVGPTMLRVYNTHLDYRRNPWVRRMQVADMLRAMAANSARYSEILLGDLNAEPDAPELRPLWSRFVRPHPDPSLRTFPADSPERRIDFVLVSAGLRVERAWTLPSTASDHRPVVATIRIDAIPQAERAKGGSTETLQGDRTTAIPDPSKTG